MSPETARWLLEGVKAFSKDPNLSEWNLLPRDYFLFILNQTLETKTFLEAREILEKIILEELTAPNIPSELEFWHQELEEAEEQKREIRKETLERVRTQIRTWQTQAKPILPLAGPAPKGISRETPPSTPKPEEPLPLEITEKLAAEDEGVAFVSVYTFLQPRVAASVIKKAILAAPVKTLQFLDKIAGGELTGEATNEWREMLHQGLNSKDIDASVLAYQEAGVSPEHPVVKNLETKRTRVKAYEQSHRLVSGILRHYHEFSKITGRRQIFLPEIKSFLPRLAQAPAWVKKQGYSWKLRQGLNQLGFVFRTHEKVSLDPGKTVVKFTLPDKLVRLGTIKSFVYQKTIGAVLTRLGKTALGQGIKKGAAWVLTRLGLAAIPTGVTQTIALALLAKDALKIGFKLLKKLLNNPLLAGLLGTVLLLPLFLLTLPLWLVPILVTIGLTLLGLAILSGAAQLGGAIISGVGSFLGGAANLAGGIFSSLTTISLPSSLFWIGPIGAPAAVGLLTAVVIINTSAAFVSRGEPEKPAGSRYIELSKNASPKTYFANEELPQTIMYTITISPKEKKLLNVKINDQTSVIKEGSPPNIAPRNWIVPEIAATWSQSYQINLGDEFHNSSLTNILTVTADIEGGPTGETASTSLTITIGTPPEDCPSGWPTDHGLITQGPGGTYSHWTVEAIDVGGEYVRQNPPAYATHQGIVEAIYGDACFGNFVKIIGRCGGQEIETQYLHLNTISVGGGAKIRRGQIIGTVGNSGGCTTGPHLDYRFTKNLKMEPPYIPQEVPRGCADERSCGMISW